MLGAVVAALIVTSLGTYNIPFLEPFLVISSAQAYFFAITRGLSDLADGLFDVSLHFTSFAKRVYRGTMLVSFLGSYWLHGNVLVAALLMYSCCTMVHCGLTCTANYAPKYFPWIYSFSAPHITGNASQTDTETPSVLRFLLLVFVQPFAPGLFLLSFQVLGEAVMRYYFAIAIVTVIAANALVQAAVLPTRARRLLKFSLIILSGRALFYSEFGAKIRNVLVEQPSTPASVPTATVGSHQALPRKTKKIAFGRPAAVGVLAVVVWVLVVFSHASMLELRHNHVISDTHSVRALPNGTFIFEFHINADAVMDVAFSPRTGSTPPHSQQAVDSPFMCTLGVHDVSVVEMSALTAATYLPDPAVPSFVAKMLGPDWSIATIERTDSSHVTFFDFYNRPRNLSVVAIRVRMC
jgi:hypothetical protein